MGRTVGMAPYAAACLGSVLTLSATVFVARAQPQERSADRGLVPVDVAAEQNMRDVEIELRVIEANSARVLRNHASELDELRIGDRVQICFRVSRAGYVSIWSQDEGHSPVQIYPNQFTSADGRVDDTEQCLGQSGSGYSFQVQGPAGESLLFMHYSQDESSQISESDYPVIRRVRSRSVGSSYASSTVGFRIVR